MKKALLVTILLVPITHLRLLPIQGQTQSIATPANARHSLIAFVSNRDGDLNIFRAGDYDIYSMNPDGTNVRNLTNYGGADDIVPAWSPDGSTIAFASNRDGNLEIYVMDADGSNPVNLTNTSFDESTPTWSSDGSRIAFVSDRNGDYEIYVMNADGSNPIKLTDHSGDDFNPSWSPDGSRIAFARELISNVDIYVMNADGSNPINLTTDLADDHSPAWSPDNHRIAFVSERESIDNSEEIFVINDDRSAVANLTNHRALDDSPSWSPDGSQIVFESYREGNSEIYIMNSDGSDPTNLTNHPAQDHQPAWSPWLPGPASAALPTLTVPTSTTPTTLTCREAPPSRLNAGMRAYVAVPVQEGDTRRDLRVRAEPGGEQVGSMAVGTDFLITGNPVCGEDGLMWWAIITLDGTLSGWSVEGFAPDDYLMIPYDNA